jgi:hypothetical protein
MQSGVKGTDMVLSVINGEESFITLATEDSAEAVPVAVEVWLAQSRSAGPSSFWQ